MRGFAAIVFRTLCGNFKGNAYAFRRAADCRPYGEYRKIGAKTAGFLYKNTLISTEDYDVVYDEDEKGEKTYYIEYNNIDKNGTYLAAYSYDVEPLSVSNIKQIHNNIFCGIDIYIDAVDLKNDEKHTVYIHCDKVQIDTNLILSVNNSQKASFTPIVVKSIPDGNEFVKDVAKIVVI